MGSWSRGGGGGGQEGAGGGGWIEEGEDMFQVAVEPETGSEIWYRIRL